jgi:hypothetical protein
MAATPLIFNKRFDLFRNYYCLSLIVDNRFALFLGIITVRCATTTATMLKYNAYY